MIFELPWLHVILPLIYWISNMFSFQDGSNPNLSPQYSIDFNKPKIRKYWLKAMQSSLTGLSHDA